VQCITNTPSCNKQSGELASSRSANLGFRPLQRVRRQLKSDWGHRWFEIKPRASLVEIGDRMPSVEIEARERRQLKSKPVVPPAEIGGGVPPVEITVP
jgi:hypothetical protein